METLHVTGRTLAEVFGEVVLRHAPRPAILSRHGSMSYAELDQASGALAAALHARGHRRGERLAIWMPNCPEWVVAEVAAARLGMTIVNVNARCSALELRNMLRQARPATLVMADRFMGNDYAATLLEAFPSLRGASPHQLPALGVPVTRTILHVGHAPLSAALPWQSLLQEGRNEATPRVFERPACGEPLLAFWTSGTTSTPKGVLLDHSVLEGVWNWSRMMGFGPHERTVLSMPLYYVAGTLWGLWSALLHGGACILGESLAADETMTLVQRWGGTMLMGAPSSYLQLARHPARPDYDLSSLRKGYVGGAPISVDQVNFVKRSLGLAQLVQVYGMTELHGIVTSTRPDDSDETVADSIGSPMPGYELKIVGPHTDEAVAFGEVGELLVRGRVLCGYLDEHGGARSADLQDGWFRTGDLVAELPLGRYAYHGRLKELIKSGGESIYPLEVEAVLRSCPFVREAAVFSMPDTVRGEVVAAAVQWNAPAGHDVDELVSWCRTRMASFKVPRRFLVLDRDDQWPRNASGKIVKPELQAQMAL